MSKKLETCAYPCLTIVWDPFSRNVFKREKERERQRGTLLFQKSELAPFENARQGYVCKICPRMFEEWAPRGILT